MNIMYFAVLLLYACYFSTNTVNGQNCQEIIQLSGEISDTYVNYYNTYMKCWFLEVPQNSYAKLNFQELSFNGQCSTNFVKIFADGIAVYTFCADYFRSILLRPINVLSNVNITFHCNYKYGSTFRLQFTIENFICAKKDHFRCSPNFCIPKYQKCNGVIDCENGADEVGCEKGIMAVEGVNISRINAINWMKSQRTQSFGWGKNTPRAITALYLSKAMTFQDDDLQEELIAKQLELQTAVALLRNASDPISISELSMFINALAITCHNPRHFYGYDLLQILSDRVTAAKSPVPSAYLTLCNLNWTLPESEVKKLASHLQKHSKYPFHLDVQALTVMALTCINKTKSLKNIAYAENMYESTVQNFSRELSDGSFGNVYTTALVTQAFISSGQEEGKEWNVTATALYLIKQLNSSSIDFLSVYLTLPIFSGRSLADMKTIDCSNKTRKEGKDKEISELTDKLVGKMKIQYSLYIGNHKDVVHTIYLRIPKNSSVYDVMRIAQVADPKYSFLQRDMADQMYVYKIADILNDPEEGKFWLLYTGDQFVNGTSKHHNESPDKFILKDGDHLIMWYRTAPI